MSCWLSSNRKAIVEMYTLFVRIVFANEDWLGGVRQRFEINILARREKRNNVVFPHIGIFPDRIGTGDQNRPKGFLCPLGKVHKKRTEFYQIRFTFRIVS